MSYAQQPIADQPMGNPGMVAANTRNSLNKPIVDGKGREWSFSICSCGDFGTCCLAWCLPCIVYGQNKQRLNHLERNGTPDPEHGGICNSDCMIHGLLSACLGVGCLLQIGTRSNIRNRYGIQGGGCSDCCTSCCCMPCALTQEEQEIALEEKAIAHQQGGYQKA